MKIGVIADVHGNVRATRKLRDRFLKEKVDVIVLNGDLCGTGSSKKEIHDVVKAACIRTRVPVIVFPGNYEKVEHYERAVKPLLKKYKHLIDGAKKRKITLLGYDLLTLPGAQVNAPNCTYHLLPDRRPLRSYKKYIAFHRDNFGKGKQVFYFTNELKKLIAPNTILLTHEPPLSVRGCGIDIAEPPWLPGPVRAGNKRLRAMLKKTPVIVVISGHIHEAGKQACTLGGKKIKARTYKKQLLYNPGPAVAGHGGIVTVNKNKAQYRQIKV